jgi:hypothetical protein
LLEVGGRRRRRRRRKGSEWRNLQAVAEAETEAGKEHASNRLANRRLSARQRASV